MSNSWEVAIPLTSFDSSVAQKTLMAAVTENGLTSHPCRMHIRVPEGRSELRATIEGDQSTCEQVLKTLHRDYPGAILAAA